jgi:peptidoglycan/LPS O-acetylase OafA/YrhL
VIIAAVGLFEVARFADVSVITLPPPFLMPSISSSSLIANLLMIGHVNAIDPPVWSLFVEMRISLMFPFIFMLVLRTNVIISLFLGLTYSILASRLAHDGSALVVDFANTSRFVYLFVVGAVLAVPNNRSVLLLKGPVIKVAVFLVAICLIEYRFSPWPLPIRNYIPSIGVALLFLL